ncbi:MAG TPA: HEAT repeat domain-containing protein, partial [Myxococcales bacterium]|nr:HEAT repeat domain-containing protein [Myxococcales bacterium]
MDPSALDEDRYRRLLALDLRAPDALRRLRDSLYDASWRVRKAAADRFTQLHGGDEVAHALVQVLGDREQTGARNAAAEALVHLGPRALGPVQALLRQHADPDQRKFAADVLGQIGSESSSESLLASLASDPDANVRAAAAEALGSIGGEAAIRGLEAAFAAGSQLLRACALESLIRLGSPPPLSSLIPLLDDPGLRRTAHRALGLIKQREAFELLALGLASRFRTAREAAIAALGVAWSHAPEAQRLELEYAIHSPVRRLQGAPELIADALEGDDVELKIGALVVAGALGDDQPAELVAEAARDDQAVPAAIHALSRLGTTAGRALLPRLPLLSAPARVVACEALYGMADQSWVTPLVELLGSGEPDLQAFAVRALGSTGSPDAIRPLLSALSDGALDKVAANSLALLAVVHPGRVTSELRAVVDSRPAPAAVWALAKIGGEGALAALKKALGDPDAAVRAAAAEAAGDVGGAEGLELLRRALADEAAPVRAAAARGLGRLPETGELIRLALADPDSEVQLAAIESAGEAQTASAAPLLIQLVASEDGMRASRAVRALARVGALSADHLRAATAHKDPEVLKEALISGAALADEGAAPLAARLLTHDRW